jgi:protein ImuB
VSRTATRTLVVWCPDWPVVAAGIGADVPAAVLIGHQVVVCSTAARAAGVRRGVRRRQAQARCPDLVVVDHDPARDARVFEPVVAALERLAPGVEVIRPGLCAVATRGPSRYFGGDEALIERVVERVAVTVCQAGAFTCQAGVADGLFAAALATVRGYGVVAAGGSPAFLAPLAIDSLERWPGATPGEHTALVDLLGRLGIRTLGAFAALPATDVLGRFGTGGRRAHRLAQGMDERPLAARTPPPDLGVQVELDPPAHRVDVVAFAAKGLADELDALLGRLGLACTRLRIEAETEHGERLARLWRADGSFTPQGVAERTRWQLDGWLAGTAAALPTGGLSLLRLQADETIGDHGRQLLLGGGDPDTDGRAARALAQVQGMLGPDAVVTGVQRGGREPAEQVVLVPWGEGQREGEGGGQGGRWRGRGATDPDGAAPWPRRIPPPWPATVYDEPAPAGVTSDDGDAVGVTGRGAVTAPPARLSVPPGPWREVVAWAGPWPVDERWWDPAGRRRRARFQVATADGAAWLLALVDGRWWVEAVYD